MVEDRFALFLRDIGDAMARPGSPDVGGLAASAGFSRAHYDRIVVGLTGESPTQFVSRILLERAAYQLTTSDAPLLEIAEEAGFASHAAFTRAFKRVYGRAPSLWRQRPGRFQLPAPSDVHFHPPAGLRLPHRAPTPADDVIVRMVEQHVRIVEGLVEQAVRVAPADLDAPIPARIDDVDGETLRWVLSRLVGQLAMWCAAMADREYDFEVELAESVTSMRRRLRPTAEEFQDEVGRVAREGRWDESFVNAFDTPPRVTSFAAMTAHVLYFGGHHRLRALQRMRDLGLPDLGRGDPKDWFDSA